MKKSILVKSVVIVCVLGTSIWFFLAPENSSNSTPKENDITNVLQPITVEKPISVEAFNLPVETGNQIIIRPFYTLSYNETHEQADWVAYTIYPFPDSIRVKRKDAFREDPIVDSGSATLKDYKNSGYDRGHLAPAKVMSYSKESMSASFFMSNMSPQVGAGFNRGIWRFLEAQVYDWSKESDSLYVVTGPVFDKPLGSIGVNNVTVPSHYYKTIIRFKNDEITGIGFLLKNEKSKKSFLNYATSIDSIEKVTGIDFYHKMDALLQTKVEANKNLNTFYKE